MTDNEAYQNHQDTKHAWYQKHGFFNHLIITKEQGGFDSSKIQTVIDEHFRI
jgi:hypothetical protein